MGEIAQYRAKTAVFGRCAMAWLSGGSIRWDVAGIPLLLLAAAGAVGAAAAGSLPLVGLRIDPELIRRD